jgi:hypothetical protein
MRLIMRLRLRRRRRRDRGVHVKWFDFRSFGIGALRRLGGVYGEVRPGVIGNESH